MKERVLTDQRDPIYWQYTELTLQLQPRGLF